MDAHALGRGMRWMRVPFLFLVLVLVLLLDLLLVLQT